VDTQADIQGITVAFSAEEFDLHRPEEFIILPSVLYLFRTSYKFLRDFDVAFTVSMEDYFQHLSAY
jgi:hypothetical protein